MLTNQLSLNYNRVFDDKHRISGLALYEAIDLQSNYFNASRTGLLTPAIDQLFIGSTTNSPRIPVGVTSLQFQWVGYYLKKGLWMHYQQWITLNSGQVSANQGMMRLVIFSTCLAIQQEVRICSKKVKYPACLSPDWQIHC